MDMKFNQLCKPHPRLYKMKLLQNTVFDILSFSNLINFNRNNLIRLMKNKNAKEIFNEQQQNQLIKWCIYIPCHMKKGNRFMGTSSYPSCLTRMILSGLITIDRDELIKELDNTCIINGKIHVCNSDRSLCFHCYILGSLCELYYKKGGTIKL